MIFDHYMVQVRNIFFFLGPILLALAGAKDHITSYLPIPALTFDILAIVGVVTTLIAITIAIILRIPPPATVTYSSRTMKTSELNSVYEFIRGLVGDDIIPKNMLRMLINDYPNLIYVVERRTRGPLLNKNQIVGFFSVFPITDEARQLLEANALKGASFNQSHYTNDATNMGGLYIGAVGARGFFARGATLQQLIGNVSGRVGQKGIRVFVRPVNEYSERLIKKYEFIPCQQNSKKGQISNYYRDLPPTA